MDGYAVADRYTAVATYTGSTTSSYVKGYTVTADYTGTVSRIALNRVRYVAIFEGTPIQPAEPANVPSAASAFRWSYVLIPLGIVAAAGAGVGGALLVKHRKENEVFNLCACHQHDGIPCGQCLGAGIQHCPSEGL